MQDTTLFYRYKALVKYKIGCIFAPASPTRPAPAESPRMGT